MADKIRKPVPKTQREISISQQIPLLDNPNSAVLPLPVFQNPENPATAKIYRQIKSLLKEKQKNPTQSDW